MKTNYSFAEMLMASTIIFITVMIVTKVIDYLIGFETIVLCSALCLFTSIILIANEQKQNKIIAIFLFVICCVIYAVVHV